MTTPGTPKSAYLHTESLSQTEFLNVPEVNTVVAKFTDYPMAEMPAAFDATFQVLFPTLQVHGLTPIGPALSLHYRAPDETATFEVGIPVDHPLDNEFTTEAGISLTPSTLPAGQVARVSHIGPFDDLGEAWGAFMAAISHAGKQPALPFWEVYVTEPTPDLDPATLRTDLYSRVTD